MATPRQDAIKNGEDRYQGSPCSKCGGTARYTCNGGCTQCVNERSLRWLKKKRKTAAKRKAMTNHGAPCKDCGGTERYTAKLQPRAPLARRLEAHVR